MTYYRFLLAALASTALTMSSPTASAQEKEARKVSLYGQVFDSFTRTYLDSAVVTVMTADSTVIASDTARTYRSGTRVWGQSYSIDVPAQSARFIIQAVAPDYLPAGIDYELNRIGRNSSFHVPAIYLKKTGKDTMMEKELDEVVVKASKVQLVWRGDTMVYDATAFNLAEGSTLDGLIRQLPGAELKEDGEILINGEKIDYLTLNGKDFFKGKNKMMLENLPYFTVKNVQVFHKSTRESEYLGHDIEKKDYVMDVQLKREYAEGYIANAEAAGGTHDRWLARAFGLRYTDNARLTLFGNANNINENRRPGSEGTWTPSSQPMGQRTYKTLNANYRYERQGKWEDEASASVEWNDTENERRNTSMTYMQKGDVLTRSQNTNRNKSFNVEASNSFSLKAPFYLILGTSVSTSPTRSWANSNSETLTNDILTNSTLSDNYTDGRNWSLAQLIVLRKALPWGDNISLNFVGRYNENRSDGYRHYDLEYFRPTLRADRRNEYRPNSSRKHHWTAELNYTLSLGKGWGLQLSYGHSQEFSSAGNPLYRLDRDSTFAALAPSLGELPLLTAALQDSLNSQWTSQWTQSDRGAAQLQYSHYKANNRQIFFNATLPISQKREREHYTRHPIDTAIVQKNVLFDLDVVFYYNDLKHHHILNVTYRHSTNTPTVTDLIGYRDESNPLSVRLGNPDLHNSSRHLLAANFTHNVPRREQTFRIASSYDVTIGQMMHTYDYDPLTGAYTYKPKNVNGNWWCDGSVNFTTTLDSAKHWRVTNETRFVRHNVAYATNGAETTTRRFWIRERFGLRYKLNDRFDVEPTAQMEWERAWSPLVTFQTTNIWDISYGVNLHWRLPWQLHLSTDLREYHRRGFEDSSLNTNHLIWNAQLSRSFLKGQLTAKLVGYDLLNQISHTSWNIGSEGISSTWQRGIPSYVMVYLSWKFSRKPQKKS